MGKLGNGIRVFGLIFAVVILGACSEKTEVKEEQPKVEEKKEVPEREAEQKEEVKNEDVMVTLVEPVTNKKIEVMNLSEMGYLEDKDKVTLQLSELAKQLARASDGYDKRMKLDKIKDDGSIEKGRPKEILVEKELVKHVLAIAEEGGGEVILPINIIESNYSIDEILELDEVILASYSTKFNPTVTGRVRNIELSAEALQNVIVGTGDTFSFNIMVGERTKQRGYQEAPEIVNKKLVQGIGGGICQTSSTLFNAVDQLDVEYNELYHHSLAVGYVPEGRDATVSWGGPDFRFTNKMPFPILIQTKVDKESGTLTIEIRTSKKHAKNS